MSKEILVEINTDTGEATVSVKGVKGAGCKALTKEIEEALGNTTGSVPTAEMQQRAPQGQGGAERNKMRV